MMRNRQVRVVVCLVIAAGVLALWVLHRGADVDVVRPLMAIAIVLHGLFFLVRWYRFDWAPPLVVLGTGLLLVLVYMTSPNAKTRLFEDFVFRLLVFGGLALLAWIWVRMIVPRLSTRSHANTTVLYSSVLSVAMFTAAADIWFHAEDVEAWRNLPIVTSAEEYAAQLTNAPDGRSQGLLIAGIAVERSEADNVAPETDVFLSYYNSIYNSGTQEKRARGPVLFPASLQLRLEDGTVLDASGIRDPRRAVNWPTCGPYMHQHCLRHGTPVVIHAEPDEPFLATDGDRRPSLHRTRAIIAGTPDELGALYVAPAIGMARVFGWVAILLMAASLQPVIHGVRRGLWLRRNGLARTPQEWSLI